MWNKEEAQKAMEKLIDETNRGIIKWRRWGSTDPSEYTPPEEGHQLHLTIPNWTVYYTKLVGTHVTVENHLGNKSFQIYWGAPVGRGGSIMDMEKELPLMDELLITIRNSNPESLPKWRFAWKEENKGPECWWMKQEHIWHTVRDTLDIYLKGEIPHYAGESVEETISEETLEAQKKESEDHAYGRVPRIRERYAINIWEQLEPKFEITRYQVMHDLYNHGMDELGSRQTLEECYVVIRQHHEYYNSPYDKDKVKEWEK
jgi:hypothetical protein